MRRSFHQHGTGPHAASVGPFRESFAPHVPHGSILRLNLMHQPDRFDLLLRCNVTVFLCVCVCVVPDTYTPSDVTGARCGNLKLPASQREDGGGGSERFFFMHFCRTYFTDKTRFIALLCRVNLVNRHTQHKSPSPFLPLLLRPFLPGYCARTKSWEAQRTPRFPATFEMRYNPQRNKVSQTNQSKARDSRRLWRCGGFGVEERDGFWGPLVVCAGPKKRTTHSEGEILVSRRQVPSPYPFLGG